jgi:glycosyltransferase involved in cell wall biosynthesis
MPASSPEISVIVPVFNQWDLIPGLVNCLKAQSLSGDSFEVLLVDNGSDSVPAAEGEPAFVRRLSCSVPGSYAARNHGVAQARGKLLVFTDADCRPRPDWLREIAANFTAPETDNKIIAGSVMIVPRNKGPLRPAELYDTVMGIPQERYVRRGYAVTANLAVPKRIFDQLGGFESRRLSGGDAEFCRRAAAAAGASLHYCPGAVVEHPARESMEALITKVRRVKGGQLTAGYPGRRILFVISAFLPPVSLCSRALRAFSFSWSQRLTVCLVQIRLWLAGMAEVLRLMFGKKPERR